MLGPIALSPSANLLLHRDLAQLAHSFSGLNREHSLANETKTTENSNGDMHAASFGTRGRRFSSGSVSHQEDNSRNNDPRNVFYNLLLSDCFGMTSFADFYI
jgi:hypothetical protein